jgi:hypothetical protein
MKHNNSNQSISGKKFMGGAGGGAGGTIKKNGGEGGAQANGSGIQDRGSVGHPGNGGGSTIGIASGMNPNQVNMVQNTGGG